MVSSLIGQAGVVKTNDGVGVSSKSEVGAALPRNGETAETDKMLSPLDGEDFASAGVIKGSSVGVLTLAVLMLSAAVSISLSRTPSSAPSQMRHLEQ